MEEADVSDIKSLDEGGGGVRRERERDELGMLVVAIRNNVKQSMGSKWDSLSAGLVINSGLRSRNIYRRIGNEPHCVR